MGLKQVCSGREREAVVSAGDTMGAEVAAAATTAVTRLLGLGSWVQGFRCFPWLGVYFFLKDEVGVSPSTLQLLQNSANLPMVGKPIYGVVSDAVYIGGGRRVPYIAIGAVLQAVSWLLIAFLPKSFITISILTILLLLSNFGASIAEVANDAIVAEAGRQLQPAGRLQSFVWMFSSVGGVLGNLFGGYAVNRLSSRAIFSIFAIIVTVQFLVTVCVSEKSLNLPQKKSAPPNSSITRRRKQFMLSTDTAELQQHKNPSKFSSINIQLYELSSALRRPEIHYSICWLAGSCAIVPILTSTMFYYQTQHLNLDSSVVGLSKVFAQGSMLAWSVAYDKWLKKVPPRRLLSTFQGTIALLIVSDFFFVNGLYRNLGIPDSIYVIIFSGLLDIQFMFKVLPFSVLMAQLCPAGCEGSLMACVMSVVALSMIVSGYFGVALATYLNISGDGFSRLPYGILIQAACALLPLYWSSWIYEEHRPHKKDQ